MGIEGSGAGRHRRLDPHANGRDPFIGLPCRRQSPAAKRCRPGLEEDNSVFAGDSLSRFRLLLRAVWSPRSWQIIASMNKA